MSDCLQWFVLACCALMCFGTNYIYDFPGVLGTGLDHTIQSRFVEHGHTYTQGMNQALYAAYSFPNTMLLILAGVLIDRYLGLRAATVCFSVVAILGSVAFFVGVLVVHYPLLVLGRLLLGCGCESLGIAQSTWNTRWFKGKQGMALAFGIAQALQRSGSSVNFAVSPRIAKSDGVETAVLIGIVAVTSSLLAAGGLMALDNLGIKRGLVPPHGNDNEVDDECSFEKKTQTTRVSKCCSAVSDVFAAFRSFGAVFWMLAAACVCVYCSALPFVGVAKTYLEVEGGESQVRASTLVAIYQITSACGSPIVGAIADRTGRYVCWIGAAAMTLCGAFVLLVLHGANDPSEHHRVPLAAMMAIMGGAFAAFASTLWPSVPLSVQPQDVGKGLGLVTGFIALTTGVLRIVVGAILDEYTPSAAASAPSSAPSSSPVQNGSRTQISVLPPPITAAPSTAAPALAAMAMPTSEGFRILLWLFLSLAALAVLWAVLAVAADARAETGVNASGAQRKAVIAARAKGQVPPGVPSSRRVLASAAAADPMLTESLVDDGPPVSRPSTAVFGVSARTCDDSRVKSSRNLGTEDLARRSAALFALNNNSLVASTTTALPLAADDGGSSTANLYSPPATREHTAVPFGSLSPRVEDQH